MTSAHDELSFQPIATLPEIGLFCPTETKGGSKPGFERMLSRKLATWMPKKDGGMGPRFGVGGAAPAVYETLASSIQTVPGALRAIIKNAPVVTTM